MDEVAAISYYYYPGVTDGWRRGILVLQRRGDRSTEEGGCKCCYICNPPPRLDYGFEREPRQVLQLALRRNGLLRHTKPGAYLITCRFIIPIIR